MRSLAATLLLCAALTAPLTAQDQASAARLLAALPTDLVGPVGAMVAQAQADGLPARVLADRALEGAAKGASPQLILASLSQQRDDMATARRLILAEGRAPESTEVAAAAAALELGVSGAMISRLARSAPSGLTVPLAVLAELMAEGVSAADAYDRVQRLLIPGSTPEASQGPPAWAATPAAGAAAAPPRGQPRGPERPRPPRGRP